jgi:hypothetical protein
MSLKLFNVDVVAQIKSTLHIWQSMLIFFIFLNYAIQARIVLYN